MRKISRTVLTILSLSVVFAIFGIVSFAFANPEIFENKFSINTNEDETLVCNYNFYMENKLSTIVPDISNHGNRGEINTKGDVRSYQILENEDVLGKPQWSFQPRGGYNGTYLEIPKSAFSTMTAEDSELTASV